MPRRRGRLRRRARRLRRPDPRALRRLPGRQPRPRGARRRSTSPPSRRPRRPAVEWTRENVSAATARVPARARAGGERERASASSTPPPATRSGSTCSRSSRPKRALDAQAAADRPDRPLPRRALLHPPRGRRAAATPRAPRPATAPLLDARRAAPGCSTPAASASRATATRAPPGWSSTPRSWTARFHRVPYDIDRRRRDDPRGRPAEPARRTPRRRRAEPQMQGKYRSRSRCLDSNRGPPERIHRSPSPSAPSRRWAWPACGGGDSADLLPGDTASEITANLDQVKRTGDRRRMRRRRRRGPGRSAPRSKTSAGSTRS